MQLELQGGRRIAEPTAEQVREALTRLNGADLSYAVLEDGKGSYMQVGGGPTSFTVEVRVATADGGFRHWKAKRPGAESRDQRHLTIGGASVRVAEAELLPLDLVTTLFAAFATGDYQPRTVGWSDITSWFA